jgi:serine/threonine-protein kinase
VSAESALLTDAEEQLRLARAELDRRLRAGEPCRAEEFLANSPALASDPQRAVELIYAEFVIRAELGEHPSAEEWYARFPGWRVGLQSRFGQRGTIADVSTCGVSTAVATPDLSAASGAGIAGKSRQLGRYVILEELGRGGMGVVYKAHDPALGRFVALKMIRAGYLATSEEVERFHREARACARLDHPNIIEIHDIGQDEDQPYYTMTYVCGGSLAAAKERFRADPRAAATLVEKLARAVHHAHEKGIIHRDLKPSNILLDGQGEPHINDFGLVKLLDADAELTQTGQIVGTPAYMAPEQAQGEVGAVTGQADVWALGVILYELLTGRRPFPGQRNLEITQQVLTAEPPPPRAIEPRLDGSLQTIVLNCLKKEPAIRYKSAGALADDLGRWLRGEPIQPPREGWRQRLWRSVRKRPVLSVTALVLVLALLALPIVLHLTDPERPLKQTQRKLAAGESVTLIGETGAPGHYRWAAGESKAKVSIDSDGSFTVHTLETALLELVPDFPGWGYRLSAEVRHDDGIDASIVGLYCARSQYDLPRGVQHYFMQLVFADWGELASDQGKPKAGALKQPAGHLTLDLRHYSEVGPGAGANRSSSGLVDHPFEPQIKPSPWRPLAVVVTPDQVAVEWDGGKVRALKRAELAGRMRFFARRGPDLGGIEPPFAPGGGLGLYVHRGSASFRNVVIEPLQAEN